MTVERMIFAEAEGSTVLFLTTEPAGSAMVVRAAGELDMDTADQLGRHLAETVAVRPAGLVIIDLRELDFLGAAGVSALLACGDVVRRHGGRLRLRAPSAAVRRVLQVTRTLDLFDLEGAPEVS
jgi:anti-sigma B factor antagonist